MDKKKSITCACGAIVRPQALNRNGVAKYKCGNIYGYGEFLVRDMKPVEIVHDFTRR